MLIHNKDDIQFVTDFPCFLGQASIVMDINLFMNEELEKNTVDYARDYQLGHCLYQSLTDDKNYRNIEII